MRSGNEVITGQQWKLMISTGARTLEQKKHEVDALNVFPVPDGDTGTNMHLTIKSAARDAEKTAGDTVAEVAAAASMGSLMGARGNSGVILSQLMRGIAKGFEGIKEANAMQLATALQTGVDTAYKAVMKPVEGTILTVSKETAKGAMAKAKQGGSPLEVLQAAYSRGLEALKRTPELLPVLKQAGVVDSGGQGFMTILEGWIMALEGNAAFLDTFEPMPRAMKEPVEESQRGIVAVENLEYPYCTEFLVKGQDIRPEQIQKDLAGRGDCLLVVGEPEVVKIHIHTKNPGKVLDYSIQWGSLHEVQIHNMLEQNEAMAHANKEHSLVSAATEEESLQEISKEHGLVVVAMGEGIAEAFKSLGADQVVLGGQTMNPSTEDLAEAVRNTPARHVYLLPNNKNIIMAAQQVNEIVTDREVHVIPSKSIPQGIAALLGFDPDGTDADNLENMTAAVKTVASGEVTYAVRDSQFGSLQIASGDILGLVEDEIVTTGKDIFTVAQDTLSQMNWQEHELITIFYGKDIEEAQVQVLREWLEKEKPDIEVEVHSGGQPLYYYIFGVE